MVGAGGSAGGVGGDGLTRAAPPRVPLQLAWRVALALALAGVAWTSLLPPDSLPSSLGLSDKVVHVVGYAVLGVLAVMSGLRWPAAFVTVLGFGLVLELLQGIVGYRSAEALDLVADALGAGLGVAAAAAVLGQVAEHQSATERERKRARRRERAERAKAPPERPMNPARAAVRTGPPRWQQVADRQGRKCWLCGTRVYSDDRDGRSSDARLGATHPVVDVVVPVEAGGAYTWDNVRLAHLHCRDVRRTQPARQEFGVPRRTYSPGSDR